MNKQSSFVMGFWGGGVAGMFIAKTFLEKSVYTGLLLTLGLLCIPLIGGCLHQSWEQRKGIR